MYRPPAGSPLTESVMLAEEFMSICRTVGVPALSGSWDESMLSFLDRSLYASSMSVP